MDIFIPKDLERILSAFVSCGYEKNHAKVVAKIFKEGLETALNDLSMGAEEPDMTFAAGLKDLGKGMVFEIPWDIEEINSVANYWGLSVEHTKTIIFFLGLGNEGYAFLRWNSEGRYENDLGFKAIVDSIPHEMAFDE